MPHRIPRSPFRTNLLLLKLDLNRVPSVSIMKEYTIFEYITKSLVVFCVVLSLSLSSMALKTFKTLSLPKDLIKWSYLVLSHKQKLNMKGKKKDWFIQLRGRYNREAHCFHTVFRTLQASWTRTLHHWHPVLRRWWWWCGWHNVNTSRCASEAVAGQCVSDLSLSDMAQNTLSSCKVGH